MLHFYFTANQYQPRNKTTTHFWIRADGTNVVVDGRRPCVGHDILVYRAPPGEVAMRNDAIPWTNVTFDIRVRDTKVTHLYFRVNGEREKAIVTSDYNADRRTHGFVLAGKAQVDFRLYDSTHGQYDVWIGMRLLPAGWASGWELLVDVVTDSCLSLTHETRFRSRSP